MNWFLKMTPSEADFINSTQPLPYYTRTEGSHANPYLLSLLFMLFLGLAGQLLLLFGRHSWPLPTPFRASGRATCSTPFHDMLVCCMSASKKRAPVKALMGM
ncbi:hypothetical protein DUNSADRAFT_18353 [Dunaliella salina]|uniref:Uncharacterized protein n=1 Tax=Dunaliella salina TaxID=3046 RepID=A0ABQ7G0D8_DUNSA|nr:hypothetical protein DUNSADRAFT_18353 [Dunaliella salina]|eukprot:KAF5828020.1 hypothetical protein DUNSADRAFT_18353 [Dunaliella salina]